MGGSASFAYKLFAERLSFMALSIIKGATTMWEHWDNIKEDGSFWDPIANSFNHYAYGSVGDWLYRTVGGIAEGLPGYKHILIRPIPGEGLDHAKAAYRSMYGEIRSSWRRLKDKMEVDITIPVNTTATVVLPYAEECSLPSEAENISHSGCGMTFKIGSGEYIFRYTISH